MSGTSEGTKTKAIFETALENGKVTAFFEGERIPQSGTGPVAERASNYLNALLERVKIGKKTDLVYDLDGVTFPAVETVKNSSTLEGWAHENHDEINLFKYKVGLLQSTGDFRVGICTGRGFDFTMRVVGLFFPPNSMDFIIAEGGGVIASKPEKGEEWNPRLAKSINQESLAFLNRYRNEIIEATVTSGGILEKPPKHVRLTLNPPKGMTGEQFKGSVVDIIRKLAERSHQDRKGLEALARGVTHTPSSVEVMPYGVNKPVSLLEMSADNNRVYFGDADGDKPAMQISHVNVSPSNSEEGIKKFIEGDKGSHPFIGMLTQSPLIYGVNEALSALERMFYTRANRSRDAVPAGNDVKW
jgi:hydroxymethylpyrimidine pyrophosphatase-like HAD family hydrolase